jgi:hypothetical protein
MPTLLGAVGKADDAAAVGNTLSARIRPRKRNDLRRGGAET